MGQFTHTHARTHARTHTHTHYDLLYIAFRQGTLIDNKSEAFIARCVV